MVFGEVGGSLFTPPVQPKYPWVSLGEGFGVQHSNSFPNPPKNHLSSEHEYGPSHFSQPRRDKQIGLWQVLCSTPAHQGDTKTKTILPPRSSPTLPAQSRLLLSPTRHPQKPSQGRLPSVLWNKGCLSGCPSTGRWLGALGTQTPNS